MTMKELLKNTLTYNDHMVVRDCAREIKEKYDNAPEDYCPEFTNIIASINRLADKIERAEEQRGFIRQLLEREGIVL